MTGTKFDVVMINSGGKISNKNINWKGIDKNENENDKSFCVIGDDCIGFVNNFEETFIHDDFINFIGKECGYKQTSKNNNDFQVIHMFDKNSFPKSHKIKSEFLFDEEEKDIVILFGKVNGRAGNENKYEFPPPIDNDIYYGTLCLVKVKEIFEDSCDEGLSQKGGSNKNVNIKSQIKLENVNVDMWEHIYDCLFGGFDDCDNSDENDEDDDDDDIYVELPTTKNGYAKDGFVVEDDEWCSDDNIDDEDEDEDDEDEEEFYLSDE